MAETKVSKNNFQHTGQIVCMSTTSLTILCKVVRERKQNETKSLIRTRPKQMPHLPAEDQKIFIQQFDAIFEANTFQAGY